MGRPLRFELRRGPDIIAYLLYYAFSVSNADRKIALIDEAQMRRALAHLVAAVVGEVTESALKVLYRWRPCGRASPTFARIGSRRYIDEVILNAIDFSTHFPLHFAQWPSLQNASLNSAGRAYRQAVHSKCPRNPAQGLEAFEQGGKPPAAL
jgi:hypothetical protein